MKKQIIIAAIVAIVVIIVGSMSLYTVGEAEQVVIVQFGEVVGSAITEPGLHVKTPWQDARRFEKRWLEWDGDPNQITTSDKRYIYIDVFARWRIIEPLVFIEKLRDESSAQGRLDDIIDSAIRNVIANHELIEAIRSTNREFARADEERIASGELTADTAAPKDEEPLAVDLPANKNDAEPAADEPETDGDAGAPDEPAEEIAGDAGPAAPELSPADLLGDDAAVSNPARDLSEDTSYKIDVGRKKLTGLIVEKASQQAAKLGIELKDVQVKRIDYIESVQAKVFERMISERRRVAEAFRSQGQGLSAEILGRKVRELKKVRSGAFRRAEEIRGRADAEAAAIYAAAYKVDPELYEFLKTLESYRETVDSNTWLLLTTDSDYARRMRKMSGGGR
jgi:membrane protease subunit HflC